MKGRGMLHLYQDILLGGNRSIRKRGGTLPSHEVKGKRLLWSRVASMSEKCCASHVVAFATFWEKSGGTGNLEGTKESGGRLTGWKGSWPQRQERRSILCSKSRLRPQDFAYSGN